MQFVAILASLALAVSSTKAAECTPESISVVQTTPEFTKFQFSCGALASSVGSKADVAALKMLCGDTACLNAFEAVMKAIPDCTVNGASFRDSFDMIFKEFKSECKDLGTSSSASTVFSTTAVAAVAVAAVVVQF